MSADGTGGEAAPAGRLGCIAGPVALLVRAGGALSTLLILAAFAITIYAIVQRYLLHAPLLWADEINGYGLVAIVMLGAAEAYRRGDHIAIDLLSGRAGPRLSRSLAGLADLAVLGFAVVLGWSTWESVAFAYGFGSYSPGHVEVPTWVPQLPLLAGAVLLALAAAARLAGRLAGRSAERRLT